MEDADHYRALAASLRDRMKGERDDETLHALEREAYRHDREADRLEGSEFLTDGQEEVFSRSEVELGAIEHKAEAGGGSAPAKAR